MDISTVKQDTAAIDAGQWVGDIPEWPGVRFKVRGIESATSETLRDVKIRALPDAARDENGNVKGEHIKRIAREILAEAVLLDWDGLTNAGEALPYSAEAAWNILTNPDFKKFQDAVSWAAGKVVRLNTGTKEALAKNSEAPFSGN